MKKPKATRLAELDLSPRGETIIDLLGNSTAETYQPFGCSWGTYMADWTPEKGAVAKAEREVSDRACRIATRKELEAFLREHSQSPALPRHMREDKDMSFYQWTKTPDLRFLAERVIDEARYPRRFIREKKAG